MNTQIAKVIRYPISSPYSKTRKWHAVMIIGTKATTPTSQQKRNQSGMSPLVPRSCSFARIERGTCSRCKCLRSKVHGYWHSTAVGCTARNDEKFSSTSVPSSSKNGSRRTGLACLVPPHPGRSFFRNGWPMEGYKTQGLVTAHCASLSDQLADGD